MSKLSIMNDFAIQQLTGYVSAYRGSSISDLVTSMGMDIQEWSTVKPEIADWVPEELVAEIDEHFRDKLKEGE